MSSYDRWATRPHPILGDVPIYQAATTRWKGYRDEHHHDCSRRARLHGTGIASHGARRRQR